METSKKLSDLAPHSENPRRITEDQIKMLKKSLAAYGDLGGIVYNRRNQSLVGAHQRLKVLPKDTEIVITERMKKPTKVGTVALGHVTVAGERFNYREVDWPEEVHQAATIAANKHGGTWDDEKLSVWLKQLHKSGMDMEHVGFSSQELDKLFRIQNKPKPGEDDVPAKPKRATTRIGDLYQLGAHRLLCGDSTDPETVKRLMDSEKASLWSSDPPYGINHVAVANEKGQAKGYKKIANDELQDEALKSFILSAINASLPSMKQGFAFYMWHAMKMQAYFSQAAAAAAGILFHRQIIWMKPQFVFGRGHYHWRHELCLMGWVQGHEPPFYGARNQDTVWCIGRENDKIHPTQKPVELFSIPIRNHMKKGEVVYEPFSGSGTGFIAAEKEKVRCFGMEIDPIYCDVIVSRWQKFTGKKAVLLKSK